MAPEFHNFDASHICVLVLTVALPVLLAGVARRYPSRAFVDATARSLAVLLILNFFAYYLHRYLTEEVSWARILPMQLCDWALAVTVVALFTRSERWFELAYFWGLGGTLQAIITPNLRCGFPEFAFISFFITHSGIVAGVLFMILAMRLRPRPWSILRTILWSEVYLACALIANALTGANYGYLSSNPRGASLLDFFPPAGISHVLAINLVAIVFFLVLYLPFFVADRMAAMRRAAA